MLRRQRIFVTADWLGLSRLPLLLFVVIPGVEARSWPLIGSSALMVVLFFSPVATDRF